jgi:hypothetical protein
MEEKQNEKEYLVQGCCQRFRGAKAEAAAIAAKRRSEFKALLEKTYSLDGDDTPLRRLYKLANSAAAKANEEIARRAEEFGMDLVFGPTLTISYGQWPEYARYSEYEWQQAERKICRLEREAASQIERAAMRALTALFDEHLSPAEAKALVQAIPAAAELLPELKREDLEEEPDDAGDAEAALLSEVEELSFNDW